VAVQELNDVHRQLSRTTTDMYDTVATALLQKVRDSVIDVFNYDTSTLSQF